MEAAQRNEEIIAEVRKEVLQKEKHPERLGKVVLVDFRPKLPNENVESINQLVDDLIGNLIIEAAEIDEAFEENADEKFAVEMQEREELRMYRRRQNETLSAEEMLRWEELESTWGHLGNPTKKELSKKRSRILKKGILKRLEGKFGIYWVDRIKKILIEIERERFSRGEKAYTKDAKIMLVYELLYGDFLHRKMKRKDGHSLYFHSHILAAVDMHIRTGQTSLIALLAALKHDDVEDLPFHYRGGWVKKVVDGEKVKNTKQHTNTDWLFARDLYRDLLSDSEDVKKDVNKIIRQSTKTLSGVTNRVEDQTDNDKLKRFLLNLLSVPHAVILKVLEQAQNARTIGELKADRQISKTRLMLVLHGIFSEFMELWIAKRDIVGAGVDLFRPDLRKKFLKEQRKRIERTLGLDDKSTSLEERMIYLLGLGENEEIYDLESINRFFKRTFDKQLEAHHEDSLETHRSSIHDSVIHLLQPHQSVEAIWVEPKGLEDYISTTQFIKDPESFELEIAEDDPLFEIVILVEKPEDIDEVTGEIRKKMGDPKGHFNNIKGDAKTVANRGIRIEAYNTKVKRKVHIRINTRIDEENSRRGVRQKKNEVMPNWLRFRIEEAMKQIEELDRDPLMILQRTLAHETMTIETNHKYPEQIPVRSGANGLDLAASISNGRLGAKLLMHITGIHVTNPDGTTEVRDPLDTIHHGEKVRVLTDDEVQVNLGMLELAVDAATRRRMTEYFSAYSENENEKHNTYENMGAEYTQWLSHFFGIPKEKMEDILGKNDFKDSTRFHQVVGRLEIEPMLKLSHLVKASPKFEVQIHCEDAEGALKHITNVIGNQANIHADFNQSPATLRFESFSEDMWEVDILKLLLKLELFKPKNPAGYRVEIVNPDDLFDLSKLEEVA